MDPQPIDPNKPLTVTHTAQDWQMYIALVNEGFRRMMDSTLTQLQMQAAAPLSPPTEPPAQTASPAPDAPVDAPVGVRSLRTGSGAKRA